MQVPPILQDESFTRLVQGIVIGAVATMLIGFYWGGWVTGNTALKMAKQGATDAVVTALAPVCVDKFQHATNAPDNLTELNKIALIWDRSAFVEKGGWATMPGTTSPDAAVARACAEMLGKLITLKL